MKEQIFTDRYGNEYTPRELVMLGEGKREILNSYQGKKAGDWERDGSGIRKDRLSNLYTHIGYVMDEYVVLPTSSLSIDPLPLLFHPPMQLLFRKRSTSVFRR